MASTSTIPALQQILGHATLAMTMRYSHLSPKHLRGEPGAGASSGAWDEGASAGVK